ncbi:hypothetical protein ACOBQB_26790 [Streptomyces sp. G5(2025)]|uniref:hypothetical protein n=1 Tax=Streptomyces sp. G5(2025) TaxID=3406628 RepID=UPI003C2A892C
MNTAADQRLLDAARAGDTARASVAAGADVDAQDHRADSPRLVTGVPGGVAMLRVPLPAGPDLTPRDCLGGISVTGIDVDHVNDAGRAALLEAVGEAGRRARGEQRLHDLLVRAAAVAEGHGS